MFIDSNDDTGYENIFRFYLTEFDGVFLNTTISREMGCELTVKSSLLSKR